MREIDCPGCGVPVDDEAPACPKCGITIYSPMIEPVPKGWSGGTRIAGILLVGAGLLPGQASDWLVYAGIALIVAGLVLEAVMRPRSPGRQEKD